MSSCHTTNTRSLSINTTLLLEERQQFTPKDDWSRLLRCWGQTDCGDCHRSKGFCGWCPIVRLTPASTNPSVISRSYEEEE